MDKTIKFAFAVSDLNSFEATHFGDAAKYLIYEWNGTEILFVTEIYNEHSSFDEKQEHGSQKKGKAIIELLAKSEVKVLVSRQFGRNMKIVNHFFIPVVIDKDSPQEALDTLNRYMPKIEEELRNKQNDFDLFMIRRGEFKIVINKSK